MTQVGLWDLYNRYGWHNRNERTDQRRLPSEWGKLEHHIATLILDLPAVRRNELLCVMWEEAVRRSANRHLSFLEDEGVPE